jgi:hypothetical protein
MFKITRSMLICAAALISAMVPGTSSADHAWGNYHWARTTNPFTLTLGNNMTGDWVLLLGITSTDWNSGGAPLLTATQNGQGGKRCSTVSGTTQVCNGKYGNNGWLGLATIYLSGEHITKGSAKMNDTYFTLAKYNNLNEKLHVVCQEVAHTFGLNHQSTDGSSQNTCMDYFSNTGANANNTDSTKPNPHDFEQLSSIYTHLDSTTTLATATTSGRGNGKSGADESDDPNSWGVHVSQSANGRSSTYEAYTQDGNRVLRHVYWTNEAASRCASCDHRYEHHE